MNCTVALEHECLLDPIVMPTKSSCHRQQGCDELHRSQAHMCLVSHLQATQGTHQSAYVYIREKHMSALV